MRSRFFGVCDATVQEGNVPEYRIFCYAHGGYAPLFRQNITRSPRGQCRGRGGIFNFQKTTSRDKTPPSRFAEKNRLHTHTYFTIPVGSQQHLHTSTDDSVQKNALLLLYHSSIKPTSNNSSLATCTFSRCTRLKAFASALPPRTTGRTCPILIYHTTAVLPTTPENINTPIIASTTTDKQAVCPPPGQTATSVLSAKTPPGVNRSTQFIFHLFLVTPGGTSVTSGWFGHGGEFPMKKKPRAMLRREKYLHVGYVCNHTFVCHVRSFSREFSCACSSTTVSRDRLFMFTALDLLILHYPSMIDLRTHSTGSHIIYVPWPGESAQRTAVSSYTWDSCGRALSNTFGACFSVGLRYSYVQHQFIQEDQPSSRHTAASVTRTFDCCHQG